MAKTILFISHDASRTGAPIFLLRFLRWFRDNYRTPFRILVGRWGELTPDFKTLAPVDHFEPSPTLIYRALRRSRMNGSYCTHHLGSLRERLLGADIGLIYSNTIANGRILNFLSFLNCPTISHVHELDTPIRDLGAENISLVKKHTSDYIAVSRAVNTNLVENHGIPEDRIRMIHGFIPTTEPHITKTTGARLAVRQELGIPPESKLVYTCGSIEPRKGVDLFLQVAGIVAQASTGDPVHFVWVGGRRELVRGMLEKVKRSALSEVVHFLGPKHDVTPYCAASDIFLLPSREDPFPLVMMEAALLGKPIVCFDRSGGAREFVEEDAGFVVPGFDVDEMANRVMHLLSSEELCRLMGTAGRQKVLRRHDINVNAPQIAAIIQDALSMDVKKQSVFA